MSIHDEIRKLEKEKEEREEAERIAVEKKRFQDEQERLKAEKKAGEREIFVKQQTYRVLEESSVLEFFAEIDKVKLAGNVEKHIIEYNKVEYLFSSGIEYGSVSLRWGNDLDNDYSYITAIVDLDTEEITIKYNEEYKFNKNQWGNKRSVEKLLAQAYMSPGRRKYVPSSGGIGFDDNGCCCCSGN